MKGDTRSLDYGSYKVKKYGPLIWTLSLFSGILGSIKVTYRVYSRYIRMLRAHTRGPWL